MARILIPIPNRDFDPTEVSVPWMLLRNLGHTLTFATPDGMPGKADPRMLAGTGLGPLAPLLKANAEALEAHAELETAEEFLHPIPYARISPEEFQGLILPGGHAPGMKAYLESDLLQKKVAEFFRHDKPVGAICHGVVLAARAKREDGRSVLHGKKTTALLKTQELGAWALTCLWLGSYYRTYPITVEAEVRAGLARPDDFIPGPLPVTRDGRKHPHAGFTVLDGRYLSARWPGDAHRFGLEFSKLLTAD